MESIHFLCKLSSNLLKRLGSSARERREELKESSRKVWDFVFEVRDGRIEETEHRGLFDGVRMFREPF